MNNAKRVEENNRMEILGTSSGKIGAIRGLLFKDEAQNG